jgi:hypothetical protein
LSTGCRLSTVLVTQRPSRDANGDAVGRCYEVLTWPVLRTANAKHPREQKLPGVLRVAAANLAVLAGRRGAPEHVAHARDLADRHFDQARAIDVVGFGDR